MFAWASCALSLVACGDTSPVPFDGGDAGGDAALDASLDTDAMQPDADVEPGPCAPGGALRVAGDYVDAEGNEHWLRSGASASTYAFVPAGAPELANPPTLLQIVRACDDRDRLVLDDGAGSLSRLDFAQRDASLLLCRHAASSLEEAMDAEVPDFDSPATGCAGDAFVVLTLGGE